ncbi:eCIS core domain-containing protein [Dyella sp. 2RAB6]|uniref:eCIS core domain-containing protein n=1 Tax=Dyella sp. 2RAB6 TaxID=3232992 RepID=UPI003F92FFE6
MPSADKSATARQGFTPALTRAPIGLRRKCGCGKSTPGGGQCSECASKKASLQRRAQHEVAHGIAPDSVHAELNRGGQALDHATRSFMEPRFGHDFSHVRVHASPQAAETAADVGASAYTVGSHIVFGRGSYAPSTHTGRQLLAHELAHVVQQGGAQSLQRFGGEAGDTPTLATGNGLHIGSADDPLEGEADAMASRVMSSVGPGGGLAAAPIIAARAPILRRRLVVNPGDSIPVAPGTMGPAQPLTNAVQNLMQEVCPDGQFVVNPTSGVASAGAANFCATPAPAAPTKSPANSSTPTGCRCLCDVINNTQTTTIGFRAGAPGTRDTFDSSGRILGESGRRASPPVDVDPRFQGQYRINGRWVDIPFHLIFAHEVCGHALPLMQGTHVTRGPTPAGGTPPDEQHAVDVERDIAAEHSPALPRRPDDYGGAARERP